MKMKKVPFIRITTIAFVLLTLCFVAPAANTHGNTSQTNKVNLKITVRDPTGKSIGNARVYVWRYRIGPLSSVADYVIDTTPDGVAPIDIETTRSFSSGKPELDLIVRVVKTDYEVQELRITYTANIPDEVTRHRGIGDEKV